MKTILLQEKSVSFVKGEVLNFAQKSRNYVVKNHLIFVDNLSTVEIKVIVN